MTPPRVPTFVNVAFDLGPGGWYRRGQERLRAACAALGVPIEAWDREPGGGRSHQAVPYWFKPCVIRHAADVRHADLVIWADASIVPTERAASGGLAEFVAAVERAGVWAQPSGHTCAEWTNDACLRDLRVSRDQAASIPMVMAIMVGFDLRQDRARSLLQDWQRFAEQSSAFCGSWQDHRHDQSVLSLLMRQQGFAPAGPMADGVNAITYGRGSGGIFEAYPA